MQNGNGSDFLRVEGVVKNFGAISVLKGVDMHVKRGRCSASSATTGPESPPCSRPSPASTARTGAGS